MLTLHSTEEEILAAFETYGPIAVLSQSPSELRQQKKVMQLAVTIDGLALTLASPELRNDKGLVIDAIQQSLGWAAFCASNELKIDGDIMELVKDLNAWVYYELYHAPDKAHYFDSRPEIEYDIIEYLKRLHLSNLLKHPLSLALAPSYIQDNKKIVQFLVSKNGLALQHASKRLQNSPRVVGVAVKQHGKALDFASTRLQNNPELLELAAWNSGIDGWFYYGTKFAFSSQIPCFGEDIRDEITTRVDLSVYDALDVLSEELKSRKRTLNRRLIAVNDTIQQTTARQNEIDESLRRAVATNEALGSENERLKEQLAATGDLLDTTTAALQEKDYILGSIVNSLCLVEGALAQKEKLLAEAIACLHETKTGFDEQLERLNNAQSTIETLTFEKEKALSLVEQTQNANNALKHKLLQDNLTAQQSYSLLVALTEKLNALKLENAVLKQEANEQRAERKDSITKIAAIREELMQAKQETGLARKETARAMEENSKLRENEQHLIDKIRSLETSRALLLRQLKENPNLAADDNQENKASSRRESSSRFFPT